MVNNIEVGDYVLYDNSICIIEEVLKYGWVHLTKVGSKETEATPDNVLQPIPLTKEFFEKNDFVVGATKLIWMYADSTREYYIGVHENDCILYNGKTSIHYNGEIKYIHQLQQLTRFIGMDKKYIL